MKEKSLSKSDQARQQSLNIAGLPFFTPNHVASMPGVRLGIGATVPLYGN